MCAPLSCFAACAGELDGEMSEVQSLHSTMFGAQSVGQVRLRGAGAERTAMAAHTAGKDAVA